MIKIGRFLALFQLIFALLNFGEGQKLLDVLKNYEILESGSIRKNVVKRGIDDVSKSKYNKIEDINFKALSKTFRLFLTPKQGLLSSVFEASGIGSNSTEERIYIDPDEFYEGHVFGEPTSKISAHFDDFGALTATIQLDYDSYIVEPAWRHLENVDVGASLIYKASDLKRKYEGQNENQHVCGFVQIDPNTLVNASIPPQENSFESVLKNKTRKKREDDETELVKNRCPVKLVADFRFFDKIGGRRTATAVRYLIALIDRVNLIYFNTTWRDTENSKGIKNMGFVIKKILIHTNSTDEYDHYNSKKEEWEVAYLLQKFTEVEGSDKFCLVHLFTYQAFAGGVLGLGYIASPRIGHAGGICGAASPGGENGKFIYYNTAFSSLRSTYGSTVVTREADIVTAHELGHNWGSLHDPVSSECVPPSVEGGFYIMHTYSVSGYDQNNKRFSPCSRRSIKAVLQSKSDICFQEEQKSFCGNKRVEEGEECDEDILGDGTYSGCCTEECKFKFGAVCSPKNSPCCLDSCKFAPAGKICREKDTNNCMEQAVCDGRHADCPDSNPTADREVCLDQGECLNGTCVSFCERQSIAMEPCICENVTESCFRCCRPPSGNSCVPFVAKNFPTPQVLSEGTRCIHGYCDNQGHCKKDVQDFVQHIWNIIEKWDINFFFKFLRDNVVGTVIIISLIFWIPISYWVHKIDRRRAEEMEEEMEKQLNWANSTSLVSDFRRVEVVQDIKIVGNHHHYGTDL